MLTRYAVKNFVSKEFMRFLLVGGCAASINFFSRCFFRMFFPYVLSVALSFSLGTIASFIFNKTYTFKAYDERATIQFAKFIVIAASSVVFASFIVYAGMKVYDFLNITFIARPGMESAVHLIAIGMMTIYNFLTMKYVSFRNLRVTIGH